MLSLVQHYITAYIFGLCVCDVRYDDVGGRVLIQYALKSSYTKSTVHKS